LVWSLSWSCLSFSVDLPTCDYNQFIENHSIQPKAEIYCAWWEKRNAIENKVVILNMILVIWFGNYEHYHSTTKPNTVIAACCRSTGISICLTIRMFIFYSYNIE
jgi:hypothetical protein